MESPNQTRPELRRVSHHDRCPICDKPDWCSVADDLSFVICMRIDDGAMFQTANGGALHILDDKRRPRPSGPTFTPNREPFQRASAEVRNEIYRTLHHGLRLSDTHRKHLRDERGLTPQEIRTLDYKTFPATEDLAQRAKILNPLVDRYGQKLLTVPGFYLTDKGKIWPSGVEGLLIPCKDVDLNIVGYQIRVDGATDSKYRWLSTPKRKRSRGGVSSGTPIHVASVESDSTRVWVTEGILKADIAALKLAEIVIGVAGVNSWEALELKRTLEKLYAKEVVIAFDADTKKNKHVARALSRLCNAVLSMGYRVFTATWDIEKGKGLDDLLVAGHQPEITRYYPPIDPSDFQSMRGEKRVRRALAPHDVDKPFASTSPRGGQVGSPP